MATDFRTPQTLTIANGTAVSSAVLELNSGYSRNIATLLIVSPATLPESITVEVTTKYDPANPGNSVWGTLQSGGADITLPAGKATQLTEITAEALRLKSSTNVAGDRVFNLNGNARR